MVSATGSVPYSYYGVLNPAATAPTGTSAPQTPATPAAQTPEQERAAVISALSSMTSETAAMMQQLMGVPGVDSANPITTLLGGAKAGTGIYGLVIGQQQNNNAAISSAATMLSAAYAYGATKAAAQNAATGSAALNIISQMQNSAEDLTRQMAEAQATAAARKPGTDFTT